MNVKLNTLKDLYVEQLQDLYSAEKQITAALPKMIKAAASPELRNAFETHLKQTEQQQKRVEQVLQLHGEKPDRTVCKAMQGIIAEGDELMSTRASKEVMDAALIASAQRVEHYEIAAYGTVCTYADQLGDTQGAQLLKQSLNEEEQTDKLLTNLAESSINLKAASV
jgi:ferritin-like metal-binding protein YciE